MRVLTAADMRLLTAKSNLLKAIDFTIGLFKRLQKTNPEWGFFGVVLPELIEFRQIVQSRKMNYAGQTLSRAVQRAYAVGQKILAQVEAKESHLLIDDADLKAFFKVIPNKEKQAVSQQSQWLDALISRELRVPKIDVRSLLLEDRVFFEDAYDVVYPVLVSSHDKVKNIGVGDSLSRIKEKKSAYDKQIRKKKPFTMLTDLVGAMVLVDNTREMGKATSLVQEKFKVLNKDNYFLSPETYYAAVNYTVFGGRIIAELQVKTDMNYASQMVSHDLIYTPEKAIAHLDSSERKLVEIVCGAIKTMTLEEMIRELA